MHLLKQKIQKFMTCTIVAPDEKKKNTWSSGKKLNGYLLFSKMLALEVNEPWLKKKSDTLVMREVGKDGTHTRTMKNTEDMPKDNTSDKKPTKAAE